MTLQTTGAISLADIRTEFGVSGTLGMNDCYSGTVGAVPTQFAVSTTVFNGNVPVSGSGSSISFNNFYGAQNIFETTIVSVLNFTGKLFSSQGALETAAFGENKYLPNLGAYIERSSSNTFIDSTISFTVSSSGPTPFGGQKRSAWTTVTWIYNNGAYKLRKDQMVSGTDAGTNGTYFIYTQATGSAGTYPVPHTPVGSKVKIRFENNG